MFKKLSTLVILCVAIAATGSVAQAQYSTLQYQVNGYGTDFRVVNYGNGFYYYYENTYGNPYYGNSGQYGNTYDNSGYSNGYYNTNYGYNNGYPSVNYNYVAPQYYRPANSGFGIRRSRW